MSLLLGQLLQKTIQAFKDEGISSARLDALLIFEHVLSKERTQVLIHQEEELSINQVRRINELTDRRLNHEPIAYLVGYKEFYGEAFTVSSDVLVPRPESEAIIQHLVELDLSPRDCVDIGTGSGALAVSIALNTPHQVTAVDISPKALAIAQENAHTLGANIVFIESDLFTDVAATYDIIVANLPYIPTDMKLEQDLSFEPSEALFSGKDGLDHYRTLFKSIPKHLSDEGIVLIEHLPEQLEAIRNIHSDYNSETITPFITKFTKKP